MEFTMEQGNPVRDLQTMLRTISFRYPSIPRLTPDGVFGEHTLEAVMVFQRTFFPPVTGYVDAGTWNAISALYEQVLWGLLPPSPCNGFPAPGYLIHPGESSVHLYLIQAMFLALSTILTEVEPGEITGVMDLATIRNTRWLQRQGQRVETGIFDLAAWETLTELYSLFVSYSSIPGLTRVESLNTTS